MELLIGNNPYIIIGYAEIINIDTHKWENKKQITISYTVVNASDTINNPRKEVKYERSELLDLRPQDE